MESVLLCDPAAPLLADDRAGLVRGAGTMSSTMGGLETAKKASADDLAKAFANTSTTKLACKTQVPKPDPLIACMDGSNEGIGTILSP